MIFINEIKNIKKLMVRLKRTGAKCEGLHGEKSQREREDAMRLFKSGKAPILLTSDLGARGLDIPKLPCVVNFDPPPNATQYVHRAGRTGRQGATGLVVSLLRRDAQSRHLASQLRGMLRRAGTPLQPALQALLPPVEEERPRKLGKKQPREGAEPKGGGRAKAKEEGGKKKKKKVKSQGEEDGGGGGMSDLLSFAMAVG